MSCTFDLHFFGSSRILLFTYIAQFSGWGLLSYTTTNLQLRTQSTQVAVSTEPFPHHLLISRSISSIATDRVIYDLKTLVVASDILVREELLDVVCDGSIGKLVETK